ncbi:NADH-quinone oxidoreductase subunit A [Fangia hongkongensis]|uniref:NADH-quinone oxidoreductase subunit A n=1 Tax=Fangia hongkongensis TaxID=270495 RepID=UPI0003694D77|nr:NADH-quinone oxidoreductase subunit A [Fangia hongkongensis]MBK2125614.1 NADH-quinone oxidoreductase subunit A [Fangia hongkongensis]
MFQHNVYHDFLPILIFLIVALAIAVAMAVGGKMLSIIVGVHKPSPEKNAPFECGFEEFEDARIKFDVRFYLVAILFLVFDLEVAFMIPWGVLVRDTAGAAGISWAAFIAMMIFLFILLVGFIYEWKKGALEWE